MPRLPASSLERVVEPSPLSAATVIMPTIIVETTTSVRVRPGRLRLPLGRDTNFHIVELRGACIGKSSYESVVVGRCVRRVGIGPLVDTVDRQVGKVLRRHDGQF